MQRKLVERVLWAIKATVVRLKQGQQLEELGQSMRWAELVERRAKHGFGLAE